MAKRVIIVHDPIPAWLYIIGGVILLYAMGYAAIFVGLAFGFLKVLYNGGQPTNGHIVVAGLILIGVTAYALLG